MLSTCKAVRDDLRAAGADAALDLEDLRLPGVWVTPGPMKRGTIDGRRDLTVHVTLIVPDAKPSRALAALDRLYEVVDDMFTAKGARPSADVPVVAVDMPTGGAPCPGIRLTLTLPDQ